MADVTQQARLIDLDAVVAGVRSAGVPCIVEQTGGGTATLFAGELVDGRYAVVAGPGWFEGPDWTQPRGDLADFYVGPDDDSEEIPLRITDGTIGDVVAIIRQMMLSR